MGEHDRLSSLRWQYFDAEQVGVTVGARISGVDLTQPFSDAVLGELRAALHDYKVLFFRDQPLTAQAHADLARRFGPLEVHPVLPSNGADSSLARFEKDATVSGYENVWHQDVTWRSEPSIVAILHAIDVPPIGGDTLFSDMYAAFESLDGEIKSEIEHLDAVHDFTHVFGPLLPAAKVAELQAMYPSVRHPVVCKHPLTGRRHLYVNRAFVAASTDMPIPLAPICSIDCAVPRTHPNTSAVSGGRPTPSRFGTTEQSSTTPPATTGPVLV